MKNIIVIGASSGIGFELARQLAKRGDRVAVTARRMAELEKLRLEFPEHIIPAFMDVTQTEQSRLTFLEIADQLGKVDAVIVNAGVGGNNPKYLWEPDKNLLETNVVGFSALSHMAYELFVQQNHGHLVGVSSVAGKVSTARSAAYSASKAFNHSYLKGLRLRAKKHSDNIFVSDIRPGFVETPMTANVKGMFWVISAEKAAQQMLDVIDHPKHVAYIPKKWRYVAAILPFVPESYLKKLP